MLEAPTSLATADCRRRERSSVLIDAHRLTADLDRNPDTINLHNAGIRC